MDGTAPDVSTTVTAYKSYEKALKSSTWKTCTAFHAGLRTVGNTKWIANEIGCTDELERLERSTEVNAQILSGIYELATTVNGANANGR